jgi:hypothetical protein
MQSCVWHAVVSVYAFCLHVHLSLYHRVRPWQQWQSVVHIGMAMRTGD